MFAGSLLARALVAGAACAAWNPQSNGPFFTGTAEVNPPGSGFVEPYVYDQRSPGGETVSMPQRINLGLVPRWDFSLSVPLVYKTASTPGGDVEHFGAGDALLWFKRQILDDADTSRFWAKPGLSLESVFTLPSGRYRDLDTSLAGTDQTGNGAFAEGLSAVMRKRFKPFQLYLQATETVTNPTSAGPGFAFPNGAVLTTSDRVVDGNLLTVSGALEWLIDESNGFGGLLEFYAQDQAGYSLFWRGVDAPSWSAAWLAPELEFGGVSNKNIVVSYGAGCLIPLYWSDSPRTWGPMATAQINFNGPEGHR